MEWNEWNWKLTLVSMTGGTTRPRHVFVRLPYSVDGRVRLSGPEVAGLRKHFGIKRGDCYAVR
jgi:hypothetical protein